MIKTEGHLVGTPDSGAVFRCEPDGSHLEMVYQGLRNPQDMVFDAWGISSPATTIQMAAIRLVGLGWSKAVTAVGASVGNSSKAVMLPTPRRMEF